MEILELNRQMRNWFQKIDLETKPICYQAYIMILPVRAFANTVRPFIPFETVSFTNPQRKRRKGKGSVTTESFPHPSMTVKAESSQLSKWSRTSRKNSPWKRKFGRRKSWNPSASWQQGIAHEINTPTQYVGDNTRFLQDAFHGFDSTF